MPDYLPRGSAINDLMRECFLLNRGIVEAGQELTEGVGVTGAQWGVLSAFAQGREARTVAETARRMGLARQSVQRVADVLAGAGLINYLPNPDDRRAKLVEVTATGRKLLSRLAARQRAWATEIIGEHSEKELTAALRLVREIRERMTGEVLV